ncbi:putative E3 ubiquitin-protein ligase SINA-like 6 [Punica granatum]|nr:putative E3 ubiquitin-protein ligase SINA-like 6 [Punica granatum]
MAKFSVGGEDLGAGPSSGGRQKRRRTDLQTPAFPGPGQTSGLGAVGGEGAAINGGRVGGGAEFSSDSESEQEAEELVSEEDEEDESDDEEEEEEEEAEAEGEESGDDEEEAEEQHKRAEEQRAVPASDRSVTFTLTDSDILDCAICYEPLRSPVFQCENGHVACTSCCVKMANKCPSCLMPIGYNRCRALEKVLESVRLTCKFSTYGCKETISYHQRQEHEKSCPHVPCYCPLNCTFIGSSKQLSRHFSFEHPGSGTSFRFNASKSICLRFDTKFHVLQEEIEDVLFLLTNGMDPLGNKITISCIGPSSKGDYLYDLVARYEQSYLKLQTFTRSIQGPFKVHQLCPYLMVPKGFFNSAVTMRLEFLIRDYRTRI